MTKPQILTFGEKPFLLLPWGEESGKKRLILTDPHSKQYFLTLECGRVPVCLLYSESWNLNQEVHV